MQYFLTLIFTKGGKTNLRELWSFLEIPGKHPWLILVKIESASGVSLVNFRIFSTKNSKTYERIPLTDDFVSNLLLACPHHVDTVSENLVWLIELLGTSQLFPKLRNKSPFACENFKPLSTNPTKRSNTHSKDSSANCRQIVWQWPFCGVGA